MIGKTDLKIIAAKGSTTPTTRTTRTTWQAINKPGKRNQAAMTGSEGLDSQVAHVSPKKLLRMASIPSPPNSPPPSADDPSRNSSSVVAEQAEVLFRIAAETFGS